MILGKLPNTQFAPPKVFKRFFTHLKVTYVSVKITLFDEENSNNEIKITYTFSFLFTDNIIEISSIAMGDYGVGQSFNETGCKIEIQHIGMSKSFSIFFAT